MKLLFALGLIPLTVLAVGPQITIYNDGFAAVKEDRTLYLQDGVSEIRVENMSRELEPDSVMLRERSKEPFGVRILEQSYVNDPLTEGLLLHQFEGRLVRFEKTREDGTVKETTGKLIRSGYVPGVGMVEQPIVETDGEIRFSLPGQPVFEGIDPDAFLKPSLVWQIASGSRGACPVEIGYLTAGMSWEATYNLVASSEADDVFDLSGWISLKNETGIAYEEADIKLIAGDVKKVRRQVPPPAMAMARMTDDFGFGEMPEQRAFDEFHLYTLPRPVLLRHNELKQVEFIRASGVAGTRTYTYNPLGGYRYRGGFHIDPDFAQSADKKVGVRMEIFNSETNNLGAPLPRGIMRMYRTDDADGRREFTGENSIDHLPKNEALKLDMGYAFDLVGERTRTAFSVDTTGKRMSESIDVELRNRKDTAVEIQVIEVLARGANWKITGNSRTYSKLDANTIRYDVPVPPDGTATVTYSVEYSW